jgi:hypothetical protein
MPSIIVAFFVFITAIGIAFPAEEDPSSEALASPPAVTTSDASVAPSPVPTAASTAVPTQRPPSTPTVPAADPAVTAYTTKVATLLVTYVGGFQEISQRFAAAGSNPSLLFDRAWTTAVGTQIGSLQYANTQVRTLRPPACLQETHTAVLEFTVELDRALDLVISGLDNFNGTQLSAGADRILTANRLLNDATKKAEAAKC